MDKKIITLTDDAGNDYNYELLDLIMYKDNNAYAVFYPADGGDQEIMILKATPNENPDLTSYDAIEDDRLTLEIYEEFKKRHPEINFE